MYLKAIILSLTQIFIFFISGRYLKSKKIITEERINKWSKILIDGFLPLLIFYSIATNLDIQKLNEFWVLPILGFSFMAFGALLGIFLKKGIKSTDVDIIKTFHHFCAINNFGFFPIILVSNMLGEVALSKLFLFNLGSQVGFWTIGIALLKGRSNNDLRSLLFNSCIIAIISGLFCLKFGLVEYIPFYLLMVFKILGKLSIFLILILVGATLHRVNYLENIRDLSYLVIVRLFIIPFIYILVLKNLPINKEIYQIGVIVALMPAASSTGVFARRFGGSHVYAASGTLITTILSIITIPIGLFLAA